MHAFHPHGALLVVTLIPGSCGTNADHNKSTGKNVQAFAEFKFRRLGKHF
jgi:hypothetical protein